MFYQAFSLPFPFHIPDILFYCIRYYPGPWQCLGVRCLNVLVSNQLFAIPHFVSLTSKSKIQTGKLTPQSVICSFTFYAKCHTNKMPESLLNSHFTGLWIYRKYLASF